MADPAGAPLLSVQNLKVEFHLKRGPIFARRTAVLRAVNDVSFDLRPGETLGLVGESGCGKSTLGRAVLRLLPVSAGRVVWLGEDLAKLAPEAMRQKRRQMQIIFQDPLASLNPRMTVGEIVGEPLATFRPDIPKAEGKRIVQQAMAQVGLLPQQINRYPHEFSGGQCQRIGIARAMVNNPKLIVCDEPVSALDVSIQAQIVNLLMDLQRQTGMALIFISHNLSVVRHISHRIMVLYLGRVMELASRDQLYANPRHPYTQGLISAVPLPDPERERQKSRVMLRGELPSPLKPPSGCVFRTRCPKAQKVCAEVEPPLDAIEHGHKVACHFWDTPTPTE
jgi:oligopeptide transport system ATP-binding protein